ncbi:uncharacterized protein M6B38_268920 [Iris pallida]|uniref:Uncharacterized protein n=1 Tax=Iris pallida TaxID=29817 RepID=A0AAX6IAY5_IRIPA|nr:uncharacterized protein M6B38_268920 [Iris pallida]
MDSRTFRELFCGLEINYVVLELFGGYFGGLFGLEIICRYLSAHFPVLGCPGIEGVLSKFLQKIIFLFDFKPAFENDF